MRLTIVKMVRPREMANPLLDAKLRRLAILGYQVRESDTGFGVAEVRNRACGRFLKEDTTDAVIMVDADMVWSPATDAILETDLPVAWCNYVTQSGELAHDGGLGCGCLRISRDVLEKVSQPWFRFGFDADGRAEASCECAWFERKLEEAKIESGPVGVIGHIVPFVVFPSCEGSRMRPLATLEPGEAKDEREGNAPSGEDSRGGDEAREPGDRPAQRGQDVPGKVSAPGVRGADEGGG